MNTTESDYLGAVRATLGDEFDLISVGPACGSCGDCDDTFGYRCDWGAMPEEQPDDEGGFSRSDCDSCGSRLSGNRYTAHGVMIGPKAADTAPVHLSICADCLQYHANGTTPEEWEG